MQVLLVSTTCKTWHATKMAWRAFAIRHPARAHRLKLAVTARARARARLQTRMPSRPPRRRKGFARRGAGHCWRRTPSTRGGGNTGQPRESRAARPLPGSRLFPSRLSGRSIWTGPLTISAGTRAHRLRPARTPRVTRCRRALQRPLTHSSAARRAWAAVQILASAITSVLPHARTRSTRTRARTHTHTHARTHTHTSSSASASVFPLALGPALL